MDDSSQMIKDLWIKKSVKENIVIIVYLFLGQISKLPLSTEPLFPSVRFLR